MWSVAGNDSLVALYSEHELQLQPLVACSTTTIFAKNMFLSEVYIVQWLYKVRETYKSFVVEWSNICKNGER